MNATTADARSATFTAQPGTGQLRRSGDDRMLAGVAGGIARYLGADVTLVRVVIAALVLFTGAGCALSPFVTRPARHRHRGTGLTVITAAPARPSRPG